MNQASWMAVSSKKETDIALAKPSHENQPSDCSNCNYHSY